MKKLLGSIIVLIMAVTFPGYVWAGETDQASGAGLASRQFLSPSESGLGHSNPADDHCIELGYKLEILEDKDRGQYAICVFPDGNACDAWRFFEGACGEDYSYCAKHGYGTEMKTDGKNPFSRNYAVCIDKRTKKEVGSVTELMGLSKRHKGSIIHPDHPDSSKEKLQLLKPDLQEQRLLTVSALPSSFDWRNKNGQNWMTSVKDQSLCGSCWAFAAVGTVEAAYNIYKNNPDLDLDLSEEYLIAGCYDVPPGNCCFGSDAPALFGIKVAGVPDETCLPYKVNYYQTGSCMCPFSATQFCNPACRAYPWCSYSFCSEACSDVTDRKIKIKDYFQYKDLLVDDIKQKLVEEGPLSVSMFDEGTFDPQGIYRCTLCWDLNYNSVCDKVGTCDTTTHKCTSGLNVNYCKHDRDCHEDKDEDGDCDQADCGINHFVVLVGYDDVGGYWILKNSWGTSFGDNGYWKIGYGECNIGKYSVLSVQAGYIMLTDKDYRYTDVCFEKDNDKDGSFGEDPVNFDSEGKPIDDDGDGRYNEDAVDCPGGTKLGTLLTTDPEEAYIVEAILNKKGKILNYNPGQYYAVSTVTIPPGMDIQNLTIEENFEDCTTGDSQLSRLSASSGGGSVVIVGVGYDGVARQIMDANSPNVTKWINANGAYVSVDATLDKVIYPKILMYVKFDPGLKKMGMPLDNICENETKATTESGLTASATANLKLVAK